MSLYRKDPKIDSTKALINNLNLRWRDQILGVIANLKIDSCTEEATRSEFTIDPTLPIDFQIYLKRAHEQQNYWECLKKDLMLPMTELPLLLLTPDRGWINEGERLINELLQAISADISGNQSSQKRHS